jgi:predicted metal-dependent phosphoesterase TrpH
MYKVDLHTHSEASHDGGLSAEDYASLLERETLDYIAITDHNRVDFALGLHKALGDKIIVGEEIMTVEGEIIGLFLSGQVQPNLSVEETIQAIRDQNGLVYIPHPFEKRRKGISEDCLKRIIDQVDIIEVYNGRAVLRAHHGAKAFAIAKRLQKGVAASSDAHGIKGAGSSYTIVSEAPNRGSLEQNLFSPKLHFERPPLTSLLNPKTNKLKKILKNKTS